MDIIIFDVCPQKSIWWTIILAICGTIQVCAPNDDGFHLTSCVQAKDVWSASICYEFSYQREEGNLQHPYAIAAISSYFFQNFLRAMTE